MNTFISSKCVPETLNLTLALDHFPCDVVRSMWLVQSINLRIDEHVKSLDGLLKDHTAGSKVKQIRGQIEWLSQEAIKESSQLKMMTFRHSQFLQDEKNTLLRLQQIRHNNNSEQAFEIFKEQFLSTVDLGEETKKDRRINKKIKIDKKKKHKVPPKIVLKVPAPRLEQSPPKPQVKEPPEEVFCYCKTPAGGKMIACDNPKCKIEWFHYKCLNMVKEPTGKWFCDDCKNKKEKVTKVKRKKRRW